MKILHTADWHIGKVLHKQSLSEELQLFFQWLLKYLEEEMIDVLLVSGDIFDLGNPSSIDRAMYYKILADLNRIGVRTIITGGNHDSVGLLNAPKEVLESLNISVIGGATDQIEDEIVEIKDKNEKLQFVVAAVPFLRDKDLRNQETDQLYENRTEAIRGGIKSHYQQLSEICQSKYPEIPALAMGHLYAVGSDPSESERDIHMGNEAAIEATIFDGFQYVALGHIHRPQVIAKNEKIRYSGSPIALSFSEKKDIKSVLIIEVKDGVVSKPKTIPVPKFRALKKFIGSLQEVKLALSEYKPAYDLPSFVELEVKEENYSSTVLSSVQDLSTSYAENEDFIILKERIHFAKGSKDTADLYRESEHIEDLSPTEVFMKRLEMEEFREEKKSTVTEAFLELLDLVNEEER